MKNLITIMMMIFLAFTYSIQSQDNKEDNNLGGLVKKIFNDTEISGQWFLGYRYGFGENTDANEFLLKRGYLTFKESFYENFSTRFTQDISVDREGDGAGDIELRLKYGYLRYQFDSFGFFTDPFVEFGLVHRPWLGFEQKINRYRVQGRMFLERFGILHSADYGITFMSLLGGEINEEYQENVSDDHPGRYGSIEFGLYNGGGYHAIEKNENKLFEGRFTFRPLPDIIPGLQISYLTGIGKGNTKEAPDFSFHVGYLSYQSQYLVLSGTYYEGTGNAGGTYINQDGKSYENYGLSYFAEIFLFDTDFSLIGRIDHFEKGKTHSADKNSIVGLAYHFLEGSKMVLDYDNSDVSQAILTFNIEVKF